MRPRLSFRKHSATPRLTQLPPMFSGRVMILAADAADLRRLSGILQEESHHLTGTVSLEEAKRLLLDKSMHEERDLDNDTQVLLINQPQPKAAPVGDAEPAQSSPLLQFIRHVRFTSPQTRILLMGEDQSAVAVSTAFQAGITDYLMQPVHPERLKQAVRQALELHEIFTLEPDLRDYHRFSECLKSITACRDLPSFSRLVPEILAEQFAAPTVSLYLFNPLPQGPGQDPTKVAVGLQPITARGLDRRDHAEGANFLSWFLRHHWRRFNHANLLRGDYPPWQLKKRFGRYNLLIPLRHRDGLIGAALVSRRERRHSFTRRELQQAEAIGTHLARTYTILCYYRDSNEHAFIDQVTGLYNQRYFDFYGEHEFAVSHSRYSPLTILTVNILSFREVNEKHGHLAGATLLKQTGTLLKRAFRDTDIVIRLDGDIFVALLRTTDAAAAQTVEKRIHDMLVESSLHIKDGVDVKPRLATCVGIYPDDGKDLQSILQRGLDRLRGRKYGKSASHV